MFFKFAGVLYSKDMVLKWIVRKYDVKCGLIQLVQSQIQLQAPVNSMDMENESAFHTTTDNFLAVCGT
jgi:hypothetical protein